jgi:hypothetical protein
MYHGVYWCTNYLVFIFRIKISNDDIFWLFVWLNKVVCIENKLFHWGFIVTLKFEYNGVEIKSFSANMIKLGCTFLDM